MRLLSVRNKMALRGRLGLVTYLVVGTAGILIVYYVWNLLFAAPALPNYKVSQNKRDKDSLKNAQPKWADLEKPPDGLKHELQKEKSLNRWRQDKALQDRLDEERLLQEQAAQQREKGKQQEKVKVQNPEFPLLHDPDPTEEAFFHELQRLVHLDLKGAPPLVTYLEQLFPLLKSLGATGLLIEYEDMFPYSGDLSLLAAGNAYSWSDLDRINVAARQNGLEIIPLVQTMGHMEFVLKYEQFRSLREQDFTPNSITPAKEESYLLLQQMIKQMLKAHPEAKRIHLGCDEVFNLGEGQSHSMLISENLKPDQLFLRHVTRLGKFIRSNYPHIKPLIWDDLLRGTDEKTIKESGLHTIVEPVVWYYGHDIESRVGPRVWEKYARLFEGLWVASAFKGATGSNQYITNASFHIDNNLQWMAVIRDLGIRQQKIKFRGIALTGWQRYDHFATLCELLPVGLPSLAMCLLTTHVGGFGMQQLIAAQKALRCSQLPELELPQLVPKGAVVTQDCRFPGSDVFYGIQELWGIVTAFAHNPSLSSSIGGWMTEYQLKRGFSSPLLLRRLQRDVGEVIHHLQHLQSVLESGLLKIYDKSTVDEWLETNIQHHVAKLEDISSKAAAVAKKTTWPRRPLAPPELLSVASGQQEQTNTTNQLTQDQEKSSLQGQASGYRKLPLPAGSNIPGNADSQRQVANHGNGGRNNALNRKMSDALLRQNLVPGGPNKMEYIQGDQAAGPAVDQRVIAEPSQRGRKVFEGTSQKLGQKYFVQNFQQPQQPASRQHIDGDQDDAKRWDNQEVLGSNLAPQRNVDQNQDNHILVQRQGQQGDVLDVDQPPGVDEVTGRGKRVYSDGEFQNGNGGDKQLVKVKSPEDDRALKSARIHNSFGMKDQLKGNEDVLEDNRDFDEEAQRYDTKGDDYKADGVQNK